MRLMTPWILVAVACSGSKPAEVNNIVEAPAEVVEAAPEAAVPGFSEQLVAAMDPDADACVDFYQYACGGWFEAAELPADRAIYTRSFSSIGDRNRDLLREILETASTAPDAGQQKLGAFYGACMDEAARDAAGVAPLQAGFDRIAGITDAASALDEIALLQVEGVDVLFGSWVSADAKNPDLAVLHVAQGGLSLPDRSYYIGDENAEQRAAFVEHVAAMLVLAGDEPEAAAARADLVLAFETRLAEVSWERAALRDADATYNKLDRDGWQALMPSVSLEPIFAALGRGGLTQVVVSTPSYFEGLQTIVPETDADTFQAYLHWRLLHDSAGDLSTEIGDASFEFYGRTLSGQQERRESWKRCVDRTSRLMGDLLAEQFVERAFPGESRDVATDMIRDIEVAFEEGLPQLAWMDGATQERAVEKARSIKNKIGYPDEWKTYPYEVSPDDHMGNVRRGTEHLVNYWLDKAEKPVDPDEWFMPAPAVNAYYNPSENEIVFPAGILQPPFFHVAWPRAANFGAMGMVMGHEITHGFDDEGRKFNADGALADWWESAAIDAFEERAQCVVDQYSTYEVSGGLAVNGELTLGENIADIGGTRVAHRAYQAWVTDNGEEPEVDGLSGEQQFFVAMAQGWCTMASDEMLAVRVKTDSHSPAEWRVNGTLRNLPEFAEAFGCDEGAPMHPVDACEVW